MTPEQTALVQAVRAHAEEHYNVNGWDFLVECWEDHDILRCIGAATTAEAAIDECRQTVLALDEQRRAAQNEAF